MSIHHSGGNNVVVHRERSIPDWDPRTWETKKRISKTFRLHPDVIERLEALADNRGISMAGVIEELISEAVQG